MRRWVKILLVLFALLLLLYLLRLPILRGIGSFLIVGDKPEKTDVMFVLSGNSFDRGSEAAVLFNKGYAPRIVCTGGNIDNGFLSIGREYYECELTRYAALQAIKDSSLVDTLRRGTSTFEERDAILAYCIEKGIKSCIVVTSPFHTRRVAWLFKKAFRKQGIKVLLASSQPRHYRTPEWWKNEYGLIDVNNEYVKLVYYFFKYGFNIDQPEKK